MSAASPNQNNMLASITASLEKSLKKCSLGNHHQGSLASAAAGGLVHSSSSSSSDSSPAGNPTRYSDATTVDLNSQSSLPYHWEQCLDLKSGEIYFINWTTGMKAQEDPRTNPQEFITTHFYSTDEEEDDDDDEDDSRSSGSSYYGEEREEGSSFKFKTSPPAAVGASSFSSNDHQQNRIIRCHDDDDDDDDDDEEEVSSSKGDIEHDGVLVVAGCKMCLMYFMVPKQVQHCPKCTTAQLLHFL